MNEAMRKQREKYEKSGFETRLGLCIRCVAAGRGRALADTEFMATKPHFCCKEHGYLREDESQPFSRKRVRRASRRGARKASKMRPR